MEDSGSQKTRKEDFEVIDIAELCGFQLEEKLPYDLSAHDLPHSHGEEADLPEKFNVPQYYWIQRNKIKKFYYEPFPIFDLDHILGRTQKFRSTDQKNSVDEYILKRIIPNYKPITEDLSLSEITRIEMTSGQAYKYNGIHLVDALKQLEPQTRNFERQNIKETITTAHNHMIDHLGSLAISDSYAKDDAVQVLLDLARNATSALEAIFKLSPEAVKIIAREELSWPVNLGPRHHQAKTCQEYTKEIELAVGKIDDLKKRGPDQHNVMTQTAVELIKYIERFRDTKRVYPHDVAYAEYAEKIRLRPFDEIYPFPSELGDQMKELRPLSTETHKIWAQVCLKLLKHATDGEPQNTNALSDYREATIKNYQEEVGAEDNRHSVITRRKKQIKEGLESTMKSVASHYVRQ